MLNHLKLLAKLESMEKQINSDFDFLTDIDIVKSFRLPPNTQTSDLGEGTLVHRLLDDRANRPSKSLWDGCLRLAKAMNSENESIFAAEVYFDILEKQIVEEKKYPPGNRPGGGDTMMDNSTAGAADTGGGSFLSADETEKTGDKESEEDCKK